MKENVNLAKYIGNKIKNYRESLRLTQDQLAQKLDTTKQTISRWEMGQRSPKQHSMFQLATIFNISMDDFYPIKDYIDDDMIAVPLFQSLAAGASAIIGAGAPEVSEYIQLPIKILGKYAKDKDLFAMRVSDSTMDRIIPDGSYIIAKKQPPSACHDRDIVLINYEHTYSLKRFLLHAVDGAVLLKAESTDSRTKDIVMPFASSNEQAICAKIIWYCVAIS